MERSDKWVVLIRALQDSFPLAGQHGYEGWRKQIDAWASYISGLEEEIARLKREGKDGA